MSVMTCTSRITDEKDVTDRFDMSKYNDCKTHGCKPQIFEFKWGRNKDIVARCPLDKTGDCYVYEGSAYKWNKYNPK